MDDTVKGNAYSDNGAPRARRVWRCRPMRPEDVPACAAIEAGAAEGWSAAALREELAAPAARLFVAEAGGAKAPCGGHDAPGGADGEAPGTAAALAVFQLAGEEASLYTVSTVPACRRQGAARALLRYALARLAGEGARDVFLEVRAQNAPARALYEALGFAAVGMRRGFYRSPPDDAVLMRRALDRTPEHGEKGPRGEA